jgi:hypothetical protein
LLVVPSDVYKVSINPIIQSKTSLISHASPTHDNMIMIIVIISIMIIIIIMRSQESAVGIATGYGLDDRGVGVRVPVGARIFSFPSRPDWVHPTSYQMGTGGSLPGRKAAGV